MVPWLEELNRREVAAREEVLSWLEITRRQSWPHVGAGLSSAGGSIL